MRTSWTLWNHCWQSSLHHRPQRKVTESEMLLLLFLPNVFPLSLSLLTGLMLVSDTTMVHASFTSSISLVIPMLVREASTYSSPISLLGPALVEAVYRWTFPQPLTINPRFKQCNKQNKETNVNNQMDFEENVTNQCQLVQERSCEPSLERRHHICLDRHQKSIFKFLAWTVIKKSILKVLTTFVFFYLPEFWASSGSGFCGSSAICLMAILTSV